VHLRRPRLRRTRRESCLARWLKIADREDGLASQTSPTVATGGGGDLEAENRELPRRTKQLEQETRSSAGRRLTSPATCFPTMTYPLVRDLADDGRPVTVTCRVLGSSKQAFYTWRVDPVSRRDWTTRT